jgi:HEAT repeat protein
MFRSMLMEGKYSLSSGRVMEVAALVNAQPRLAARLIPFLWDEDPGVAQRAADVLERVSRHRSPVLDSILNDSKDALLSLLEVATLNKTRWNLALVVPRITLSASQVRRAVRALQSYLDDSSSIVKTAALQGLADLTIQDTSLLAMVLDLLRIEGRSGTAAMRARSRILLKKFESPKLEQSKLGQS